MIIDGILEAYELIVEKLKKPIYADKEVDLENTKSSSQTSTEKEIENSYVTYDPFAAFVNNNFMNDLNKVSTHNELIKKWRAMSLNSEVDEALGEIINEAVVYDDESNVVELNLDCVELSENIKDKIRESFNKILFMLNFNESGDEIFRQWYVDGTLNFEVVYNNSKIKEGIQKLVLLSPFNFFKFKDETTGTMKYFYCANPTYNHLKDLGNADKLYLDEQIVQINSGIWDPNKKISLSNLNKAMRAFNMMNSIEDSLIIFRISRAPERRVFYIDTGNLPKTKAEEYVKSLITKHRQKKVYNSDTGTIENRSNQISILEDFWFPISQGQNGQRGTRVESLAGLNPGFGSMEDVDHFQDKLYKALNVPRSRKSAESRLTLSNTVDIEKEELKFFKFILKLRRKFNNLFIELLKRDCLAKNIIDIQNWNIIQEKIKIQYANSNEFSEIKKLQILTMRMDAAAAGINFVEMDILSKAFIQKRLMNLTDEEIEAIKKEREEEKAAMPSEEMTGGEFGGMENEEPPSKKKIKKDDKEVDADSEQGAVKKQSPFKGKFNKDKTEKKDVEETETDKKEVKKESKSSTLSNVILENLKEGDIISNGKNKLIYRNGKLEQYENI